MALDALRADNSKLWPSENRAAAIEALRAALAAPVGEPVAWIYHHKMGGNPSLWSITMHKDSVPSSDSFEVVPLYAHPPAPKAEPVGDVEASALQWMRERFGAERGHPEWRLLMAAYVAGFGNRQPAPSADEKAIADAVVCGIGIVQGGKRIDPEVWIGPAGVRAKSRNEYQRALEAKVEALRNALHRISLASQNSMSSKDECGRIAREVLKEASS